MYLNTQLMTSKGLSPQDVACLQLIRQNSTERLNEALEAYVCTADLTRFDAMGLLSYIKAKKKGQSIFELVRLSKKGSELLEDIQIPEYSADDEIFYNWLSKYYTDLGKSIGSKKKTKMYISLFRAHSGIDKNKLALLCKDYISSENNMEYNHVLEYLFFKAPNVFTVKFSLDNSRLYGHYIKNQEMFDSKFAEIDNESVQN